ncbi:MAG: portal protein [Leptospirales bacterium]|jgi:hypothetical protein
MALKRMPDGTLRNVGGRPRGKNYLKNCERNGRTPAADFNPCELTGVQSEITTLAKSFFGSVLQNERAKSNGEPVYDQRELELQGDGVLMRHPGRPTYTMLRNASYRTSLVGAVHQVRIYDWSPYCDPFGEEVGFGVMLEDRDAEPTQADEKTFREAREFLRFMGDRSPGWSGRPGLKKTFQMMLRDTLAIDRNAFYLSKNRRGGLGEVRYVDPATIFTIDRNKGYRGDRNVAYVQIIDNEVVMKFAADELLLFSHNELSDVYYRDGGYSPTEACILDLVGVIRALSHNRQKFSNNPPRGFLSYKGHASAETLAALHEQFQAVWSDNANVNEFPILGSEGDITWQSLEQASDVEFDRLMQWLTTLVLAAHSMDQSELGMRLYSGNTLGEANPEGRIFLSSQRAKRAILSYYADIFNTIKLFVTEYDRLTFYFRGIDPADKDAEIDRAEKETRSTRLVDEVRRENDLPTIAEEMRDLYDLSDEEFEKVKFAGAYINNSQHLSHTSSMLQELRPEAFPPPPATLPFGGPPEDSPIAEAANDQEPPEEPSLTADN